MATDGQTPSFFDHLWTYPETPNLFPVQVASESPTTPRVEESTPNVWTYYRKEAGQYDADFLEGWKGTIDILIVFAGLFSAVVSAFLVEAVKDLRSTSTEKSALTRADPQALWVNALWFTSLTVSLIVALVCVISRQWVSHYVSHQPTSTRQRALVRHFRHSGLKQWHVPLIVSFLPLLVIASLFLFLAGLALFVFPLSHSIAAVVITLAGLTFILYVIATILPVILPQCPYKSPLTFLTYDFLYYLDVSSYQSLAHKEWQVAQSHHDIHKKTAYVLDWLYRHTTDSNAHTAVYTAVGELEEYLVNANSVQRKEVQDILTHKFKGPNVALGLVNRIQRSRKKGKRWIRSEEGKRLARACCFFFRPNGQLVEGGEIPKDLVDLIAMVASIAHFGEPEQIQATPPSRHGRGRAILTEGSDTDLEDDHKLNPGASLHNSSDSSFNYHGSPGLRPPSRTRSRAFSHPRSRIPSRQRSRAPSRSHSRAASVPVIHGI